MIRCLFPLLLVCYLIGCVGEQTVQHPVEMSERIATAGDNASFHPIKLDTKHLPNSVQIHSKVISGGLPEGDAGFAELASLGVVTIISVDGATPDVEAARRHGMRYVHLPHGYDGITDQRVKELAKAVRELEGPIYIHCHHGKHRSPAAASVACVAAGLISNAAAVPFLELAGTSRNYRGLYQAASDARKLEASMLDQLDVEFRERVSVPPMAEAMVRLDHTHDNLKLIGDSDWRTPPAHPDLEPAHEALQLREHFTELLRTDEVKRQPEAFIEMLRDSESSADKLEKMLRDWQAASYRDELPAEISKLANRIDTQCTACHVQYRDIPFSEK